jgi:hypothetical protein
MAGKGTVGQLLVEMRADLGKLRVDVKEMEGVFKTSFTNVENLAKSFGNILGAAFSAGAIIAYGKQIVNLGGQLKDLSLQTGISSQTLSGLKSTLEENGTSLDAFAKGIFTLQKNLGGIKNETDPAAQAVKALGLNLDEVRNANTEDFLKLITDALGNVSNPLNRAALGAQLLGKSFRELGPAILEMSGRLAELKAGGISEEDIEILDRWGDSWTRISNTIEVYLAGQLSRLIEDLDNISRSLQRGYLYWKQFWAGAFHEGFIDKADIESQLAELLSPQSHTPAKEPGAKFKPPIDEAAAKKAAEEIKAMVEALQKSNAALQAQIIELNSGKEAAQNYTLQQQEMEENSKHITAAIKAEQERRRELTDQLRLEGLARDDLHRLAEQSRKDTPLIEESTRFGLTPEQQREFNENQARTDQQKIEARKQIIKLEQQLGLGLVPEENDARRIQELKTEFGNLALQIGEVGREAGLTEDQINSLITTAEAGTLKSIESIKSQADKLGEEVANSLTSGLKNTLMGIETGDQSIGEGMKNLLRNMMLELQGAIFDKTILEPLKAIASGFISGLVGALDEAANKELKAWAKRLGQQVSQWVSQALGGGGGGLAGLFGGGSSAGAGSMSALDLELGWTGLARGGMIPSFASGGLFIGHGGEFVMQKKAVDNIGADTLGMMNKTGKVPGGGAPAVNIEINGDITPRQPNMTPDQVVRVTAGNITNDGMVMSAIEQRLRLRGK